MERLTVIPDQALPAGGEGEARPCDDDEADGVEVTDAEWAALTEAAERVRQGNALAAAEVLAALARRR